LSRAIARDSEFSGATLDCRASLAMTLRGELKPHPVIARSSCDEAIQSSGDALACCADETILASARGSSGDGVAEPAFAALHARNLDLNHSRFRANMAADHRTPIWGRSDRRRIVASLTINGKTFDVDVEPDTPLLWAIRENVGLTGTKYGCGIAQCGACTVHIDGVAVRSCGMLVSEAAGKQITTIEGLAENGVLHKVQQAWIDNDVPQCGYCQSGMIMAVAALLKDKPKPTDADIDDAITNICRCGTFQQVRLAVHAVANA
jgi:isoquinoline 1-oxidoreductase alpha subunit